MPDAAVPALWSAVHGWFTPAVLFVLLNLVIATIAVASRLSSSANGDGERRGALLRAPSLALDRLRSFSFSRLPAARDDPAPALQAFDGATEPSLPSPAELGGEGSHSHSQAHIERSRSEAAAGGERLPARMRKSASERSAFAHFAPPSEEVVVEARRPATAREAGGGGAYHTSGAAADGDEEEPQPAVEVDARADEFIQRFREQLRLQRLDSILRCRDMLRRGHHAGSSG